MGIHCGTVSFVEHICYGDAKDAFQAIHRCEPEGLLVDDYVGGGSLFDAFLEVITKGRTRDRFPNIPPFPKIEELQKGYSAIIFGSSSLGTLLEYFKEELKSEDTWFFLTQEGYLGVTQSEVIEGKFCYRAYLEIAKLAGDTLCVALGCDYPLLLRPLPSGDYILVSQCFVHGLMDGERLLGSLPDFWTLRMLAEADGREVPCYFHGETKKLTRNDPRLPSLSSEWERVQRRHTQDDPSFFQD